MKTSKQRRAHLQYRNRIAELKKKGLCYDRCGAKSIKGYVRCQKCINNQFRRARRRKVIALTHYGKGRKLKCCWRGCNISDLDMLSIDHMKNNGAKDRRKYGNYIYNRLINSGFPDGFQTLCHNHQWKKLMALRKLERKSKR